MVEGVEDVLLVVAEEARVMMIGDMVALTEVEADMTGVDMTVMVVVEVMEVEDMMIAAMDVTVTGVMIGDMTGTGVMALMIEDEIEALHQSDDTKL